MGPTMNGRNAKRLYDLDIDEVSLVDRSANQHATVAIAKKDGDDMTVMDERGVEVNIDDLQPGDVVFDTETGEPLVACEEGAEPEDYYDFDDTEADELAEVGKALVSKAVTGTGSLNREAARAVKRNVTGFARRNKTALKVGAGAGAAGFGAGAMSKSLGEEVYETLSKALNDDARNETISKALQDAAEAVRSANERADEAVNIAKALRDELENERFNAIAEGYGVPGDPGELATILKSLDPRQAAYLDRVMSSVGEQLYDVYGADLGDGQVEVMGQVEAMAQQAVGKSDVSTEAAIAAIFAANPDAYDEYLAEQR